MKKILGIAMLMIVTFSLVTTLSQEGFEAKQELENSRSEINAMIARNISTFRINEIYSEAEAIYLGQTTLENLGRPTDYTKVLDYIEEIKKIKEIAFQAQDELKIFKETYEETAIEIDLSDMDEEYSAILKSFSDERFEETLELINEGYKTISEIESSQTALKAFYSSVYTNIKKFIINRWKILGVSLILFLILFSFFRKTILIIIIKNKIKKLEFRKKVLNHLIAKLQKSYFENKGSNELEYRIRTEQFKKMIRDINREIPSLKESMLRIRSGRKKERNELEEKMEKIELDIRKKERKTLKKSSKKKSIKKKNKSNKK